LSRRSATGALFYLAALLASPASIAPGIGVPPRYKVADASPGGNAGERPNVVLVVVDTLRADHLTTYGWPVPTSPNLQATLARRGVVVERAYSQAPWTIPSMVGLMTGRWPGEVIGRAVAGYGIPADTPTLAAFLHGLGYETAAFVANPSLVAKAGFARGFGHYYVPPPVDAKPQWSTADHVTRMARQWLSARRGERPFFLYVHYVEPHDPYASPDLVAGRSPFFPGYRGIVNGDWPQGLLLGKIRLPEPANDRPQLSALYDSEVHSADRWLGALLAGFDEATRARTLFAFTADHGEELYDHGGWKHGRTVYEEQLRVPLVLRWDGRLPAGARVPGPVRLIDLAPTIAAAAGAPPPAAWQGEDLLPLLRGEAPPQPRPAAYAAHYLDGPRRAAAVLGRWKLALFDRAAHVVAADGYEAALYRLEMARLPRLALFDLATDPRERRDVAALYPAVVASAGAVVQERMGREVPGLRVLLAGVDDGATVSAELRFRQPPGRWESSFLAAADRVRLDGDRLRLQLVGEALPKGVLLPEAAEITSVGLLGPAGIAVRLGGGATYRGGPVDAAAAVRDRWPPLQGPRLLIWQPVRPPEPVRDGDAEARKRLQALGYAG
jgi:arylsulfatase A-like enzyme